MIEDFFIQLVLILLAARFLGDLATRLHIPAVIGELSAGILLGPSLFNWIEPTDTIKILSEIGIVLLLFEVGIESNLSLLKQAGRKAFLVAIVGVALPFALGYVISSQIFHLELLPSLFVGSLLTATSIGITIRVLVEIKKHKSPEAQIVLGAAVIDDIIGIILLAILYEFTSTGGVELLKVGKVILYIGIFLVLAPIAAAVISKIIKSYGKVSQAPGLIPTMIVSLLLFFAWLAHVFGAPMLLGGFAAGLALSKHFFPFLPVSLQTTEHFTEQIEHQMKPIIHLFTPIFFVTIGLTLNLREVEWSSSFVWSFSAILFIAAILGKLSAGFVLVKESNFVKWAVGLAMIPRGEVGLIFAEVGKSTGVFTQDLYAIGILVIALTTLLPPFAIRYLYSTKQA